MFSDPTSRLVLCVGVVLVALIAMIGWLMPEHGPMMLLGGVFLFFVLLIVMQTVYAIKLFKQDRIDREKHTTPCPHCDAPLYSEDRECPYCKTPRPTDASTNDTD